MLLRLSYLVLTGMVTLLRLLAMSNTDKNIEILALRHQHAVLQRQIDRPRLTPPDRALLAALLHKLPRPTLRRLLLFVCADTILRWHRDLLRRRHAKISAPDDPVDVLLSVASESLSCVGHATTPIGPPENPR